MKDVVFENGITAIPANALIYCDSIESVTLPDSVKNINYNAFKGCNSLTEIKLPKNLQTIGEAAFNSCSLITEVTMPDALTNIYDGAFDGCSKLKTVKLNQGLQTIGGYAFRGTIIESISIPKSVTALASNTDYTSYVNRSAFGGATNLKDVVFENGITAIPANAFVKCESIESILLPESVTSVGNSAFGNCTSLKDVYGFRDTYAQTFAEENELNFIPLDDNHEHTWGEVTYKWSSDNKTCTATRVCLDRSTHIETETATATSKVTKEPTTTSSGTAVYTATFKNTAFKTQTKNVTLDKLPDPYKGFPDVKEGAWYYDAVKHCAQKGYISGYANGNFGPNDNLKRQDFVVILSKIAGADLDKYAAMTPKLKDVKKGAYYAAAVNWAVDNNIIAGYANGNFGVNDNITREQVATILYRYMGSPEVKNVDSTLKKFSDVNRISSFAKTAVAWAVQNNVISGMADGRVAPTEGAARAQIASIIMRMDQQGMFNKA